MGDFEKTEKQKKIDNLTILKNTLCSERVATSYKRYKRLKDLQAQRSKNGSVISGKRK